jgi:pilus assembly protein CpaC
MSGMTRSHAWRLSAGLLLIGSIWAARAAIAAEPAAPRSPVGMTPAAGPIVHIVRPGEKLEITVNTSRILTLQRKIPQAMVANPDLLTLNPLSPTQIQISAKKPGVTQVNLWDEKQQIYTIDVVITGDARELASVLSAEFPNGAIRVRPVANGVLISGYVDRPEDVDGIRQLAEEYYPKVINHLTVAGVQQVLLHVKVYEVSRTKLRQLGFDFSQVSGGAFVTSAISDGISGLSPPTLTFSAVNSASSFLGVLGALRQNDLAKILSEPTLVTQSGRPAYFNVGGEIPYAVSQGLGAVSVEWKNYGTRLDFVPFVLGNGRIRLEVRPSVSEVDNTRSTVSGVPAIKIREQDTGVEIDAGQTLAIGGLVQTRIEAQNRGLPFVSDVPYIGALFRRVKEESNEIETLILVTPEIVEALDPHDVPPCPPGTNSASPDDCQLYFKGKLEVPSCCPMNRCNGDGVGSAEVSGDEASATSRGSDTPASRGATAPSGAAGATANSMVKPRAPSAPQMASRASRYNPSGPQGRPATGGATSDASTLPGFLGPIGYDVGDK